MASALRPGGYLAVQTALVPDLAKPSALGDAGERGVVAPGDADLTALKRFFGAWWYRQDTTHITFYSRSALIAAAAAADLLPLAPDDADGKGPAFFRKASQESGR
jgi:hypothetical protein